MTEVRELSNAWAAIPTDTVGEWGHVIPLNDLQDHILSPRCWCSPHEDDDCEGVWIHNSADARELYDSGALKVS